MKMKVGKESKNGREPDETGDLMKLRGQEAMSHFLLGICGTE